MAMQVPRRLLQVAAEHMVPAPSPQPMQLETQVVVILVALLSALICVVGMALCARCAWLRRYSWGLQPAAPTQPPAARAPDKGLSRNSLLSLPRLSFHPGGDEYDDCPICLAEFAGGDEVTVLPQCGHRFHVACVDPWLGSHSSCPSCRRVLDSGTGAAALSCDKCGARCAGRESPAAASGPGEAARAAPAAQEEMEEGGGGGQ